MLSLNLCFYGLRPRPGVQWPTEAVYDIPSKVRELIGPQLLTGDDRQEVFNANGQPLKLCVCEIRGDWVFHKQLLNLACGWNAQELCHHCLARSDNYLVVPSPLAEMPRRTSEEFAATCKPDSNGAQSILASTQLRFRCTSPPALRLALTVVL